MKLYRQGDVLIKKISMLPEKSIKQKLEGDIILAHGEVTGHAHRIKDGWGIYAWHGVRIPEYIILKPESISIQKIEDEKNTEIRRVMITRYGQEKYLLDSNAKKIHSDDYGILYKKEIPDDEPLLMVKVVNSTPEPDGTFKDYFLRVPPNIKTAREAVAWTFDEKSEEYLLTKET